jgi:hypothetical protein
MWYWTVGVGVLATFRLVAYIFYLRFMRHVFDEAGAEGVQKIAKAVPAPRSIESAASAVKAVAQARTRTGRSKASGSRSYPAQAGPDSHEASAELSMPRPRAAESEPL